MNCIEERCKGNGSLDCLTFHQHCPTWAQRQKQSGIAGLAKEHELMLEGHKRIALV